jgi:hypothetical protein
VGSRCISLKDTCNLQPDHTRKRIIFTNCDAFDFEYRFFVARASEYSVLVLTDGGADPAAVICVVSGADRDETDCCCCKKPTRAFTITRSERAVTAPVVASVVLTFTRHGSREKC